MPRAPFKKKEGPKPMDIELGKRLRVIRTELGFTQEALAVGLGLTFQQVQKYEQGKNRVSISTLMNMCRVLGVTYELFLHGLDDPAKGASKRVDNESSD